MGAIALLVSWCCYRYTDLLSRVPFARALDWVADKMSGLVSQPWAAGMTGVVLLCAAPAVICGLLLGLISPLHWPISVVLLLLCMGPQRLFEAAEPVDGSADFQSLLTPERYHALAARDVVGALLWAAILGAPGAVFYRAARELAESPAASLQQHHVLIENARTLFGLFYWLPARLYALAQVASGSGGRLQGFATLRFDTAAADELVLAGCGDSAAAVLSGPRALLLAALGIVAVVFLF